MTLGPSDVAAALLAVAPHALGGLRLRMPATSERETWLQALRDLMPAQTPWRRLPLHATDEALDGGLDLTSTLQAGRPVMEIGLLDRVRGGVAIVVSAERLPLRRAALLGEALDDPEGQRAFILLDEGLDEEAPPDALLDRLGLHLRELSLPLQADAAALASARTRWTDVSVSDASVQAVVRAAASLGITSPRAALQALTAARVLAALATRTAVSDQDLSLACGLVLGPKARHLPSDAAPEPETPEAPEETPPPHDPSTPDEATEDDPPPPIDQPLDDRVLEAVKVAIPAGLLAQLTAAHGVQRGAGEQGKAGALTASRQRGRPVGTMRGEPRGGARLALMDTLRAAAPWQPLRRAHASTTAPALGVRVTREDLRVQRRVQRRSTTTIFAIDASGSQALQRLGEAKGAVELLLADCYSRRDRVAVIGFRSHEAQLLLPPTRSLARAKRQLAGLPGGGGTPLAAGIDAATALAQSVRRSGSTPLLVLLTDGRANVARDRSHGRQQAMEDAQAAAKAWFATGAPALLIDTSAQPGPAATAVALALGARCVTLPHAGSHALSSAVTQAQRQTSGRPPHG